LISFLVQLLHFLLDLFKLLLFLDLGSLNFLNFFFLFLCLLGDLFGLTFDLQFLFLDLLFLFDFLLLSGFNLSLLGFNLRISFILLSLLGSQLFLQSLFCGLDFCLFGCLFLLHKGQFLLLFSLDLFI
jgi:hypothetical protein